MLASSAGAASTVPVLSTVLEDNHLFNVQPGGSSLSCFVHTYFYDGDYCVPDDQSANTKRIFSILAQLLALKTKASVCYPEIHPVVSGTRGTESQ